MYISQSVALLVYLATNLAIGNQYSSSYVRSLRQSTEDFLFALDELVGKAYDPNPNP